MQELDVLNILKGLSKDTIETILKGTDYTERVFWVLAILFVIAITYRPELSAWLFYPLMFAMIWGLFNSFFRQRLRRQMVDYTKPQPICPHCDSPLSMSCFYCDSCEKEFQRTLKRRDGSNLG